MNFVFEKTEKVLLVEGADIHRDCTLMFVAVQRNFQRIEFLLLSASLFAMLREKKRRTMENNVADDRQVHPTVARLSAFASTRHAVDCLNSGRDVVAAIRHLQEATADSSCGFFASSFCDGI